MFLGKGILKICSKFTGYPCRSGNETMFFSFQKEIEEVTIYWSFSFLSPFPDCSQLGKCLKASFRNWYIQLQNEGVCLSFLHTLRNSSDKTEMKTMRKFLLKNDYVRTKRKARFKSSIKTYKRGSLLSSRVIILRWTYNHF